MRRAGRADAGRVFALTGVLARSFVPEREAFDASFTELVASPHTHVLVADGKDGVVGYLLGFDHPALFANGRVGWIEELVALATTRAGSFYETLDYTHHAAYYRKVL